MKLKLEVGSHCNLRVLHRLNELLETYIALLRLMRDLVDSGEPRQRLRCR
jgi:hypothetical protein